MQKTYRFRVLVVAFLSLVVFGAIEVRLYIVQIRRHDQYERLAKAQQERKVTLVRRRGEMLDRNGRILATSTFYNTINYYPHMWKREERVFDHHGMKLPSIIHEMKRPSDLARKLARLLSTSESKIEEKLARTKRTTIWRKVPPETIDQIKLLEAEMNLPKGLFTYEEESKRLYPQGDLAGPLLGFTKIDDYGDNVGLAGLELQYDPDLRGQMREAKVPSNLFGQGLAPLDEKALKDTFGDTLVLTLDSQLQLFTQKALRRRVGELQAKGGVAVVMDAKTGGLLALAVCPDFDPNVFQLARDEQRRNRALTDPIEIGSVMKIITATILIDNNLVRPDEMVDCEGGRWSVDGRVIRDSHPVGVVPFRHAFAESSNVGAVKMGLRLEPGLYYRSLEKFGLGQQGGIDLPGEGVGIFRPLSQWTRLTRSSLPMGYEVALTAIQVTSALAAVANGGSRMRPHLVDRVVTSDGDPVRKIETPEFAKVASPETCRTIIGMMEGVVEEGTGAKAKVPGYTVAGKTGTTRKLPKEPKRYIGSFAGIIPAADPRVVIYVYVDEPDPRIAFYGGTVAAPIFAEIAGSAMRVLNVPPDKPEELLAGPANAPAPGATEPAAERMEMVDGEDEEPTAKEIAMAEQLSQAGPADAAGAAAGTAASTVPGVATAPAGKGAAAGAKGGKGGKGAAPTPTATPASPFGPEASAELLRQLKDSARRRESEVKQGVMPNLKGLTMRQALDLAEMAGVKIRMMGSGLSFEQSIAPETKVEPGTEAVVIFTLPSQRIPSKYASDPADTEGTAAQPQG